MGEMLLKSRRIYTPYGVKSGGVLVKGNKIKAIITDSERIDNYTENIIDVGNNAIIPGLIDIHIHGGGGWTVTGGTAEEITGMAEYLSSRGITAFQPSIGGSPLETIKDSLKNIKEAMNREYSGAKMLGIHMEGPFISPEKKGAFSVEFLLKPSVDLMKEFMELSAGNITHVTLAPELEGAGELIDFLKENNILISGGHTNATVEETKRAVERGVRLSNHTSNAQSPIHHREPGALGGYLLDDRVDCEVICDSFHVHPDMIKLIIKLKTKNRVCMISDSIPAAGVKPGEYFFLGRKVIIDENGWSRLPNGTIAGSTKDLLYGLKNMAKNIGFSMEDAIWMASLNPARISGCEKNKGSIEVSKDADLVVIDDDFNVQYTFVEGKIVYASTDKRELENPKVALMRINPDGGDGKIG